MLQALADAELVVASDLTLVECDRVLIRVRAADRVSDARLTHLKALLDEAAAGWHLLHLDADTIARARRSFPREPVRTLDALHLAIALSARAGLGSLGLLTLDRRLGDAARDLGLDVLPGERA